MDNTPLPSHPFSPRAVLGDLQSVGSVMHVDSGRVPSGSNQKLYDNVTAVA